MTKYSLPKGWAFISLEEITIPVERVNAKYFEETDSFYYIDIASISNLTNKIENPQKYRWKDAPSRAQQVVRTGDILFSTVRPYLRNIAMVPSDFDGFIASSGFCVIRPLNVNPIYLFNQILSKGFVDKVNSLAKGTSYPAVTNKIVLNQVIPLPPLKEQARIAVKLEELFSEIDYSIENLRLAQEQLKVYRQVILKQAFEGELSRIWRKAQDNIDSVEFLTRVRNLRKDKYYEQLNEFQAKKAQAKPKKDFDFNFKKHKSIKGWATVELDKSIYIAARIGWRGLKKTDYINDGPNLLSVHSLNHGKIVDFTEVNHISEERYRESPEIQLEMEDILLCKDGAGIGKIGIIKNLPAKSTVNSSILVIRGREIFNSDFLYYLLSGPSMQKLVNEKIQGSAIPHLFQKDIKKFSLVVPPLEEQEYIVSEIESQFTLVNNLELTIQYSQSSLDTTRQSVLKKTFQGKLVQQDPNDKPATELIKRIREEKIQHLKEQKYLNKNILKKVNKTKKPLIKVIEENFQVNEFSYEELKEKCKLSYEELRAQLFELIDSNNRFKSRFDGALKEIKYSLKK